MNSFIFRLLDTILEFQRQVQERILFVETLHNEIHQLNILTNTDQINIHNQAMNDHLHNHHEMQHNEIHQNNHMDHTDHMNHM